MSKFWFGIRLTLEGFAEATLIRRQTEMHMCGMARETFRPRMLVIEQRHVSGASTDQATGLLVMDIKVERCSQLATPDPIPAEVFAPQAMVSDLSMAIPVIRIGRDAELVLKNSGDHDVWVRAWLEGEYRS